MAQKTKGVADAMINALSSIDIGGQYGRTI
jgi:hypothetical protein